jgi:hypothetical protein
VAAKKEEESRKAMSAIQSRHSQSETLLAEYEQQIKRHNTIAEEMKGELKKSKKQTETL